MVSVIIPSYGRECTMVMRAVESIKRQTYEDWELYVVDDNKAENPYSKEIEEAIKKENSDRIHYLRMERNSGACAARNKGIEASKGEYIAFLDDDDEWLPEKIEKQLKALEEENAGFVYCGLQLLDEQRGQVKSSNTLFLKGNVYSRLLRNNFIGGTVEVLVKRECLKQVGGFREDMPAAQDYELWLRLARRYKVTYVPEDLVLVHFHEGETITKSLTKRIEGHKKIYASYYEDIAKDKKNHSFYVYILAKFMILNKDYKEGIKNLIRAISLSPLKAPYYIMAILYRKLKNKDC